MNTTINLIALRIWLLILLVMLTLNAQSQLQQANSIKTFESRKSDFIVREPPIKIDTISLRIDTTNIYERGERLKIRLKGSSDSLRNELNNEIAERSTRISETRSQIRDLEALIRNRQRLTQEQQRQLSGARAELDAQGKVIDSLTAISSDLSRSLNDARSKTAVQLEMKIQYRKEYHEKLMSEARANLVKLDSNYRTYSQVLTSKADSLTAKSWPLYPSNKDSMIRDMATIYSGLLLKTNKMKDRLDNLIKHYPDLTAKVKAFEEVEILLRHQVDNEEYIDKLFSTLKNDLFDAFLVEKGMNDSFQKEYESYRYDFTAELAKVNSIWTSYKPVDSKQSSDASLLANFIQPLSQNASLIPGIDIFAYKKFNSKDLSIYGQAKLFLAAAGSDTNTLAHALRFFIPEASQFGFMADFNFGFLPASTNSNNSNKLLGINLAFYYLQKELVARDSVKNSFGTGMVQVKAGIELILIKNTLSVYGNMNGFLVGKGLESYKKYYSDSEKFQWFSELGLRSYLILQSDAKINLLLDLRFLPVGNTIRSLTLTKDRFVPLFKLGFVKEFEF